MLNHQDLRKGARIIVDGTPFEILESMPLKKAQRRVVIQTRIKNLISGSVMDRNFHQGDVFEEAELTKINIKFLYTHRNKYFFCEEDDPSKRFDLDHSVLGQNIKFLKPNSIIEGIVFDGKIINVSLPIKIQVKVTESPPGVRGDRAQGGTKIVRIETGAEINVPLFIEEGNIIEINTETGEYVKKIE